MIRRRKSLLVLVAMAAGVAWAVHHLRDTSECEALAPQEQWEAMARVCEQTYHRTGAVLAAAHALYALSAQRRTAEVEGRLVWLEGTRYAPAILYFRGKNASIKGDDETATGLFSQALASSRAAGLHQYAALAAHQLASLQWAHGQFQAEFATLDTAFEEAKQCDDEVLVMHLEGQLADLLGEVGDLTGQARALSSLVQRAKDRPWTLAQVRFRQGMVEVERANPRLAKDDFELALLGAADSGLLPIVRAAHVTLASLARSGGDLDGGEAHLLAAAAIRVRYAYEETTWAYAKAQLLRARGDCGAAREVARLALDAGAVPDWQWKILTLEGSCAEQQGDDEAARRAFSRATEVIEELRREKLTEALSSGLLLSRREPYEARFELSLRAGDTEAALEVMEHLLAGAFLEAMARRDADEFKDLVSARLVAERRLAAFASTTTVERGLPRPVMELMEGLRDRDALGFIVARGTVYRAHARDGRVEVVRVERLQRVVELLDRLAAQPDELGPADALGELLWPPEPVAERVIIAADGPLANLSFAGLRRNGRWVVEDHVVSRAPSLGAAALLASRPRDATDATDGGVRVLGDPTGDLPAAAAESVALAQKLGVRPLRGNEATVAALMRSCHADLLHFAGHSGLAAEGGWLALADGQVFAPRLLAAGCAPRLVYLASCASGARAWGQGAATLADAFFASGSEHVIATSHSVDDGVAASFTHEFFLDGAFDHPADRVAQAQRRLLKTHPRSSWEPFFVLGP